MIRVKNVNKRYGDQIALDNVNLHINDNEVMVICGPSGSGKSTLLKVIAGLEGIEQGEIWLNKHLYHSSSGAKRTNGLVGMVFQGAQLYSHLNVIDNITLSLRKVKRTKRADAEEIAYKLLMQVGLVDKAKSYPSELSGGESQRIAIVRVLAMEPAIILFDEPTSALDPCCVKEVLGLIYDLSKLGRCMVLVTHETGFARMVADRIVCMDNGRVHEVDSPQKIILDPQSNVSRRLFGDSFQEISTYDRVVYTGCLNIGCNKTSNVDHIRGSYIVRAIVDQLGCEVNLKIVSRENPELLMRMSELDLFIGGEIKGVDCSRMKFIQLAGDLDHYYLYYFDLDTVWKKILKSIHTDAVEKIGAEKKIGSLLAFCDS